MSFTETGNSKEDQEGQEKGTISILNTLRFATTLRSLKDGIRYLNGQKGLRGPRIGLAWRRLFGSHLYVGGSG